VAELGTTPKTAPDGTTKPMWIRQGYPAVYNAYPAIKAIIYQEVDNTGASHGHPTWGLMTPSGSYDAYGDVARQARFKGKVSKKGKIY
jgi:hypothetical protein